MLKAETWQVTTGPAQAGWASEWTEGTFYIGVMAAYNTTQNSKYLTDATTWAAKNKYTSTETDANGWCADQVYADLYLLNPTANATDITAGQALVNSAMGAAPPTVAPATFASYWGWADALFMGPGLVARLGAAAGTTAGAKYFTWLDSSWAVVQSHLYDPKNKLFWRDSSFVNTDTYWSRGNGWVMAGTVRVLEYLPTTDASYTTYTTLLQNMAGAVAAVQGSDGLWRSNLLDATQYPNPETSGTGLMTFAIAWGINHGILDSATYKPVVTKAWQGLVSYVNADGMLEYVQPTGSQPGPATATDIVGTGEQESDYGTGAFLLAGSEVAKLQ